MIAKTATYIGAGIFLLIGWFTDNKDISWMGVAFGLGSATAHIGIAFDMMRKTPRKRRWKR